MSTTSTRWKTWFGTYSSSHFNTVQSHYSHISGDPTATTYDCSCTESDTYAYTVSAIRHLTSHLALI